VLGVSGGIKEMKKKTKGKKGSGRVIRGYSRDIVEI
jgi:hypothetical protein